VVFSGYSDFLHQ